MEVESIYGILICGILKGSEWRIVIIQLDKFNIAVFIIAAIIAMGRAFCCTGSFSVSLFLPNKVAQIGVGPILCQDKVYSEMAFIGDLNGLKVLKSEGHK